MHKQMEQNADNASKFLKSLAHAGRLMILCHLIDGEKNVTELIDKTGMQQSTMSQNLNKLRQEKIVDFRRDHRTLYYKIHDPHTLKILHILKDIYC